MSEAERARKLRRRHMHERQAVVFGVLLAFLALAFVVAAAVYTGNLNLPWASREFTNQPSPSATHNPAVCPPAGALPVAAANITVNVYNGQGTTGLACSVHYAITNQWQDGFGASVTITNTGSTTINGWTLVWNFANGQTITQIWSATDTQAGGTVSATNASYNGTLAPGGSTNFGFNGSWNGSNTSPAAFTLNGTACAVS